MNQLRSSQGTFCENLSLHSSGQGLLTESLCCCLQALFTGVAYVQRRELANFMFPTRSRTKISSLLSYPANAKLISEALADVPQAQVLSISFFYWPSTARMHQCPMPYPVMSVEYSYQKASQFTPHYFEETGMNEPNWSIWVQPVPSTLKHRVKQMLQGEALPKIHAWLVENQNLTGKQEAHSLTVWYDEAKDELQYGES